MVSEYVGIDLHRRRSVIVRQDRDGEVIKEVRIDNDPVALACEIEKAGRAPEVVLEATYGWYWAVDVLQAAGAKVHLAHPLGVAGWAHRRVKNDRVDAAGLADLLRMNRLPEAWIAPPELRELRELVRYRAKLVALRSGLKAQIHSVLAKQGVAVPLTDLFGLAGMRLLAGVQALLDPTYRLRVQSLLDLIDGFDYEIAFFADQIARRLRADRGYQVLQTIPGVGPVLGAVFVAEIGDVTRFPRPSKLACWAGLTPRHRESDTVVHRGHITKQGSPLVRWAAIEAVQRQPLASKHATTSSAAPAAAVVESPRSPRLASCSRWSITACATARSAACHAWPHDPARTRPRRALARCHDPRPGAVVCLIEPARPRPHSSMPPVQQRRDDRHPSSGPAHRHASARS